MFGICEVVRVAGNAEVMLGSAFGMTLDQPTGTAMGPSEAALPRAAATPPSRPSDPSAPEPALAADPAADAIPLAAELAIPCALWAIPRIEDMPYSGVPAAIK
jgi:hypothetical protein